MECCLIPAFRINLSEPRFSSVSNRVDYIVEGVRKHAEAAGAAIDGVEFVGFVLIHQSYASAQDGHTFITPSDLRWTDVPAMGAGAKIAVIEGPMNEAVPFTVRIKLP